MSSSCKLITLGKLGVGKTSCIAALGLGAAGTSGESVPTLGLDFSTARVSRLDKADALPVRLHVYDTSGQERFATALTPAYLRNADVCLIVLDACDDDETLAHTLHHWHNLYAKHATSSLRAIVTVNRCDMLRSGGGVFVAGPKLGRAIVALGLSRYHVTCAKHGATGGTGLFELRRDIDAAACAVHDARAVRDVSVSIPRPRLRDPNTVSRRRCCGYW